MSEPETRTGTVTGALYPHKMQGATITVEVTDEFWGRCHEYSTWVRLEDIEPLPDVVPPPAPNSTAANNVFFGVDPASSKFDPSTPIRAFSIGSGPTFTTDPTLITHPLNTSLNSLSSKISFSMDYTLTAGPETDRLLDIMYGNERKSEA